MKGISRQGFWAKRFHTWVIWLKELRRPYLGLQESFERIIVELMDLYMGPRFSWI